MEVRIHPNRGDLLLKMLEANPSLHKDTENLLNLLHDLDADTPENQGTVLRKAATAAIAHRDFEHAFHICESITKNLYAAEVWSLFQELARATEWPNLHLRKKAAIHSLRHCPKRQFDQLLEMFRELELSVFVKGVTRQNPSNFLETEETLALAGKEEHLNLEGFRLDLGDFIPKSLFSSSAFEGRQFFLIFLDHTVKVPPFLTLLFSSFLFFPKQLALIPLSELLSQIFPSTTW